MEKPTCVICLEVIDPNTPAKTSVLSCSLAFHTLCIDKWFGVSPTCPICRKVVSTPEYQKNTKEGIMIGIVVIMWIFFTGHITGGMRGYISWSITLSFVDLMIHFRWVHKDIKNGIYLCLWCWFFSITCIYVYNLWISIDYSFYWI